MFGPRLRHFGPCTYHLISKQSLCRMRTSTHAAVVYVATDSQFSAHTRTVVRNLLLPDKGWMRAPPAETPVEAQIRADKGVPVGDTPTVMWTLVTHELQMGKYGTSHRWLSKPTASGAVGESESASETECIGHVTRRTRPRASTHR